MHPSIPIKVHVHRTTLIMDEKHQRCHVCFPSLGLKPKCDNVFGSLLYVLFCCRSRQRSFPQPCFKMCHFVNATWLVVLIKMVGNQGYRGYKNLIWKKNISKGRVKERQKSNEINLRSGLFFSYSVKY